MNPRNCSEGESCLPPSALAGVVKGSVLQPSAFKLSYFYPAGLTQNKFRSCPRAKWKLTLFPEEKLDTRFLYFHSVQPPSDAWRRIQTRSCSCARRPLFTVFIYHINNIYNQKKSLAYTVLVTCNTVLYKPVSTH